MPPVARMPHLAVNGVEVIMVVFYEINTGRRKVVK
jgi:hypothetical protein